MWRVDVGFVLQAIQRQIANLQLNTSSSDGYAGFFGVKKCVYRGGGFGGEEAAGIYVPINALASATVISIHIGKFESVWL